MRKMYLLCLLICLFSSKFVLAQTIIFSENFNAGFGGWTNTNLTSPWGNTIDAFGLENIWQVSDSESGMSPGTCGAGGMGNPSLYMGASGFATGAAYSSTANTNRRIASPNINTVGHSNMTLSFNFIGNGCDTRDRAYFQYSTDGGTSWTGVTGAPTSTNPAMGTGGAMDNLKSQICGGGQGMWTNITWNMPVACENISNLRIAFVWQNSDGVACASGSPVDPSFAVDNIEISVPSGVLPPVADFSASQTEICAGECINFTDLSTNTPTGWNWTFTGASTPSSTNQNPTNICYPTPGDYSVTLVATNAGGSDTEIKTTYITVHANPTINLGPDTTICSGDMIVLDAGAGYTGYTWLPSGSTQTINVNSSGTYSVTVTDANTCQGTDAINVNVVSSSDATITPVGPFCTNDPSFNLSAVDAGGVWSGVGITNASLGTFSPSTAGSGNHQITYTIAGSCGDTDNIFIQVNGSPTVNLGPDTTICSGDMIVLDAGAGYTGYTWLPSGSTQTINVNTSGTYSVTVTDANTCQGTDAIIVNVVSSSDATITPVGPFCANDPSFNLSAVDAGGVWSGVGITNASLGTFSPSTAGSGNHQITYTIAGSCGDTDNIFIQVNGSPTVNLGPDTTICSGDMIVLDAGAGYTGYTWLPSGSTQTINVTTSGTYSVTVTDANTCQGTDAIIVNVVSSSDATITPVGPFCTNDPSFNLSAVDAGGVWSGVGITNASLGTFSPSTAGSGNHQITYTIAGSCGDTDNIFIQVNGSPTVNLGPDTTICSGDMIVLDAGAGFANYAWSPSGSTQTINVNTSGTYTVTVTDANTCQGTDAINVNVVSSSDATITPVGPFCANDPSFNLSAVDAGGVWSGVGITNASLGTFSPSTAGSGNHQITYTIAGSCGDTDDIFITVHSNPIINLTPDTIICSGDTIVLDAGAGFSNYVWSPSGNTQTIEVSTSGIYSVTVTDMNSCTAEELMTLIVLDYSDATIITTGPFCDNILPLSFTANDAGGVWSGPGITTAGLFSPSGAGAGTHTITYTISGLCGDSDAMSITVFPSPQVSVYQTHETCAGADDGWAYAELSGGTSPYTWIWSTGTATDTIFGLTPDTYSYQVTDNNGCQSTLLFDIVGSTEDCSPPHVYVPNIFSPNGDGENDMLYVRGEGIEYLEFIVFSRWGEKVFETTSIDIGWDGTYKGGQCEVGVYSYVLRITWTSSTNRETFSGNITIVR
jgi:gliding motility-associated-like protein